MLTILGMLNTISAGGGASTIIQSIQQGSITIANGSQSNTLAISSVTTANTMLVWGGVSSFTTANREVWAVDDSAYISLTDATTVTATRLGSKGALTVRFTVLEFASNIIANIQNGSVSLNAVSSANATITSAVVADTFCHWQGSTYDATASTTVALNITSTLTLVGPTIISSKRTGNTGIQTSYFTAVQFKPNILNQATQHVAIPCGSGGVNTTAAITSAAVANTVIFFNGYKTDRNSPIVKTTQARILSQSATEIIGACNDGAGSAEANAAIVTFKPTNMTNAQNKGTIIMGAAASAHTAISSAATTKSIMSYLGNSGNAAGSQGGNKDLLVSVFFNSATTAVCETGIAATGNSTTIASICIGSFV